MASRYITTEFDARLQHPFTLLLAGPSGSGKTRFVNELLKAKNRIVSADLTNIVYVYGCYQPIYDEMKRHTPCVQFLDELPERLDDDELFPAHKNNLLILDDIMASALDNPEVENAFTKYSHHRSLSVILISQNLFFQGKKARTISLNANYLVLYKNVRDTAQAGVIARQMYSRNSSFFLQAYKDATERPYSYLLIDLKPACPDKFRLRSQITERHPIVYLPRKGN